MKKSYVNAVSTESLVESCKGVFTEFDVNKKKVIELLVKSQNGSLAVALIELASNCQDAGSTRIDIVLTSKMFRITDNGKGFKDEDDIHLKFRTLGDGVDVENDTNIGRFHIGRSQIFSHAKCKWKSNGFEMHVDYKKRMGFELLKGMEKVEGCIVEGEFYKELDNYELHNAIRQIESSVKMMRSQVFINGIHSNKEEPKWTFEDDILKLHLANEGNGIDIYSNGVFIKTIPHHQYALSGTILTKRRISLNLARNQTNDHDPVWKHIQLILRNESKLRTKKSRITPTQKRQLAISAFRRGEPDILNIEHEKIFRDICGKYICLSRILASGAALSGDSSSDISEPAIAEVATRLGSYIFLHPNTYNEWGVSTPQDLVRVIKDSLILSRSAATKGYEVNRINRILDSIDEKISFCSSSEVAKFVSTESKIYTDKELNKNERARKSTLQAVSDEIAYLLNKKPRTLKFGKKDSANGFTDSSTFIAVDIDHGKSCLKSEDSLFYCITLILHEYTHDRENVTSDSHGLDFYQEFHDSVRYKSIISSAHQKARHYVRRNFGKLGVKKPAWMNIKEEDFVFNLHNSSKLTKIQKDLLEAMNITVISSGKSSEIVIPIKSLKTPSISTLNKILGKNVLKKEKEIEDDLASRGIFKDYGMPNSEYFSRFKEAELKNLEEWLNTAGLMMPFETFSFSNIRDVNEHTNKGLLVRNQEHDAITVIRNIAKMFPNVMTFSTSMEVNVAFFGNSEVIKNSSVFSRAHSRVNNSVYQGEVDHLISNQENYFKESIKDLLDDFSDDKRAEMIKLLQNRDFVESLA